MQRYRNSISLAVVLMLAASATGKNQVSWLEDLNTAQQMAASRHQLLLLHFTADWCGPCQRLEKKVFSEPSFGYALNSEFVPCKINVTQHPELAARFGVTAWPTDLLLTPDGKEVHRMVSPQAAEPYLTALRQANWQYRNAVNSSQVAQAKMPPQYPQQPSSQLSGELSRQLAERFGGARGVDVEQAQFMQLQAPANANPQAAVYAANGLRAQPTRGPQVSPPPPQATPAPFGSSSRFAGNYPQNAHVASREQRPLSTGSNAPQAPYHASPPVAADGTAQHTDGFVPAVARPVSDTGNPPGMTPSSGSQPNEQIVVNQYAVNATQPTRSEGRIIPPAGSEANLATGGDHGPAGTVPATFHMAQPNPTTDASANASTPDPGAIRLGLDGYCPVTLLQENQWLAGNKRWGAKHRGVVYLFQTAAAQQIFLADPDRFSPLLAGYDPVLFCEQGQYVVGQRAHGIRYRDTIILFSSEESLEKFSSAPEPYMSRITQALSSTVADR